MPSFSLLDIPLDTLLFILKRDFDKVTNTQILRPIVTSVLCAFSLTCQYAKNACATGIYGIIVDMCDEMLKDLISWRGADTPFPKVGEFYKIDWRMLNTLYDNTLSTLNNQEKIQNRQLLSISSTIDQQEMSIIKLTELITYQDKDSEHVGVCAQFTTRDPSGMELDTFNIGVYRFPHVIYKAPEIIEHGHTASSLGVMERTPRWSIQNGQFDDASVETLLSYTWKELETNCIGDTVETVVRDQYLDAPYSVDLLKKLTIERNMWKGRRDDPVEMSYGYINPELARKHDTRFSLFDSTSGQYLVRYCGQVLHTKERFDSAGSSLGIAFPVDHTHFYHFMAPFKTFNSLYSPTAGVDNPADLHIYISRSQLHLIDFKTVDYFLNNHSCIIMEEPDPHQPEILWYIRRKSMFA